MGGSGNQRRLYEFLKTSELGQRTFTVEDASAGSGLSAVSVRTYLSKKLIGRWVERTDGTRYRVKGVAALTPAQFAAVMTQKTSAQPVDLNAWMARLRELVQHGLTQGYPMAGAIHELLKRHETE